MKEEMVETDNLVTVRNFARMINQTPAHIYKMEKAGEIFFVDIDGVKFVDVETNKSFLNKSTRKVTRGINKVLSKIKQHERHSKPS
jgi:hypothetical protein